MVVYAPHSEYVLGWGTLALLNASVAQLQGRSALLWLLISLFIGPIATIILIVTYRHTIKIVPNNSENFRN